MNPKSIEHNFIRLVNYWSKRLKIGNVIIEKDNRKIGLAQSYKYKDEYHITYNLKLMIDDDMKMGDIIQLVFHELAHLKKTNHIKNWMDEEAEYIAEKQSLKWMKQYYLQYYHSHVKKWKEALHEEAWGKTEFPMHRKAFLRIKEYQKGE